MALTRPTSLAMALAAALVSAQAVAQDGAQSMVAQDGAQGMVAQDGAPETPAQNTPNRDQAPYFPRTSEDLRALIADCETDDCMSYVSGAIGGIAAYALLADNPSPFCTQGEVAKSAIRDAIVETIDTTPELAGQHPALAILTAFGRHWPCIDDSQIAQLRRDNAVAVAPEAAADLAQSGTAAIALGPDQAAAKGVISVFHDPNCGHCQRFRDESDRLAELGWRVLVYPVATTAQESAGYGAVEIALSEDYPDAAEALYRHTPDGIADITTALDIAREAGVSQGDALTAIARSDAYERVERNTGLFGDLGARGTPSWVYNGELYSGFVGAPTIVKLLETSPPTPGTTAAPQGATDPDRPSASAP